MRRVNIQAAFVGEPSHASEGLAAEDGDEAVVLLVRAGEITAVVPQDTRDDNVLEAAQTLRGTLHLENERVLTFEIQDAAVGAFFEDEPAALYRRRQEAGGVGMFAAGTGPRAMEGAMARDLMKTALVTATPDMHVEEAAALLSFHRISGMPVVEGDRVVGVISEADIIGKQGRTVADIMTSEVLSVVEDTPADQIATLLTGERIRRVPVLRGGRLVGIISRGDIVRWVAGHHLG